MLVIRFSVIPSHFSTAVFSTCDVKFWHFAVATFLTLPKQIILVYFGVLLVQKEDDSTIKSIIFGVAFAITAALGVWIWMKMRKVRAMLLAEQEARRANREMNGLKDTGSTNMPIGSMENVSLVSNTGYPYTSQQSEASSSREGDLGYYPRQQQDDISPVRKPRFPHQDPHWI